MLAFTHTMHDYNLMVNQRNVNKKKKTPKISVLLRGKAVVKCSPGSEVNP